MRIFDFKSLKILANNGRKTGIGAPFKIKNTEYFFCLDAKDDKHIYFYSVQPRIRLLSVLKFSFKGGIQAIGLIPSLAAIGDICIALYNSLLIYNIFSRKYQDFKCEKINMLFYFRE